MDASALKQRILSKLIYQVGKEPPRASPREWFMATAMAVRDSVVDDWQSGRRRVRGSGEKRVYYLSMEFLVGRLLADTLGNLGEVEVVREALAQLGVDFNAIRLQEPDPALGNGGLGRLAACYMDSMATLGIPAYGYGIRYEHGLFRQVIVAGEQHEVPETWLAAGNPWEFARPDLAFRIPFGGQVAVAAKPGGGLAFSWQPSDTVFAVAYDTPVVGWRNGHANTLRLWSALATDPLALDAFNRGDHVGALGERVRAEAISRVLYPADDSEAGQELRLRQEFFFTSASLQDLLRRHIEEGHKLSALANHVAIQLNDTHPALAIAEMMRLMMDIHGMEWDEAWTVTRGCFSYTNHTLMPEALETWSVGLLGRLLPRHLQIIYHLNFRHLDHARTIDSSEAFLSAVSLVDESHGRRIRMGHLAFLGSHTVNGVSALHTELLTRNVFGEMLRACGNRIVNRTNGITFRRWLHTVNPDLTALLVEKLGEGVLGEPELLAGLRAFADDRAFQARFAAQRRARKLALAKVTRDLLDIEISPDAMFDVQVKRMHEYKRQLLNILQTIAQYNRIRANPSADWVPRVKVFAGKAAASYYVAKQIIRLANDVAGVINNDPITRDKLKLVFLPNYNVSLAETIIPAADLSEQISTAGMEASGTGNMKFALNGAITIGTLDGANVEIRDHVGHENMIIFGLTADEAWARRRAGPDAERAILASPVLTEVLQMVAYGAFSPGEPGRYSGFVDNLRAHDNFLVTTDFDAYVAAQDRVDELWRDPHAWWATSIRNTAGVGWFSSDRAIREYAEDTWHVKLRDPRRPNRVLERLTA